MPLDVSKLKEKAARETAAAPSVRPSLETVTSDRLQELRRAAPQALRADGEALLELAEAATATSPSSPTAVGRIIDPPPG